MSDSSVFAWLCELRHSVEAYEHGVRPLSGCGDLAAVVFRKREEEMAAAAASKEGGNRLSAPPYENKNDRLEIKHADICRVSVEFQDCVEEEDFIEPVTVDNFEVYVTKDVLYWLSNLWYSSEDEDDEEEFTSALENYQERNARTPRFPVEERDVEQDIELRQHDKRRSPRSQTMHIMPEAAEIGTFGQKSDNKEVIEIRSPKWTYDGQNRERVPLMRFQDGELTAIKENALPELIASDLQISKKTPKKIELTDTDNKVYIIKSDSIKQGAETKRERSNSLTEKPVEKKKNILQKLLKRRSNRDLLERKGILMNEEIFGNTLMKLYEKSRNIVPVFVRNTIALIEIDKNIRSEHIYRIPGNLAIIQKIRVNIDRNNIKILDEFKNDPDVLTGALKLFFRELKEPLIPYRSFEQLLKVLEKPDELGRLKLVKNVIEKMECPHRETFETLIEHLLKVEAHTEDNKMNVHSLSIVWGPSLLWPADYTKDNVYDFSMIVNKVIELILDSYKSSRQSDNVHMRNEYSLRRVSDRELNSIKEDAETSEESVKSSPKQRLRQQIIGFVRSDSKDKVFGSNFSLASSYENESEAKTRKDVYGYRLQAMPKKENSNVPELIYRVTSQIEKHAHVEGIYTQGGDKEKVSKLRRKIKPELQKADVHDLITWLKTIIQELEEPLVPPVVVSEFIENYDKLDDVEKQKQVSTNLGSLKPAHRETVEHLVHHLLKILACKDRNKLDEQTISIIWAPLFHPPMKLDKSNKDDLAKYLDFVIVLLRIYENQKKKIEVTSVEEGKNFRHNIKFASVVKGVVIQKKREDLKDKIEYEESTTKVNEGPKCLAYRKHDDLEINTEVDDGAGINKTTIEMISEKFKDIEIKKRNSEEFITTKDDASGSKITLGTVAEKLKDIMKSEATSKKKITNKISKKPLSYYENVPVEVYREVNKSDLD